MNLYIQGDVILRPVPTLPTDASPSGSELSVSSETGNAHALKGQVYSSSNGLQYVVLEQPAVMEHPEHGSKEIPAGVYQVDTVGRHDFLPRNNLVD